LRQKDGASNTKMVKSSRRPRSMPNDKSHFAESGKVMNAPEGPIVEPNPGPTFEMAVAAPETAVKKSNPMRPSPIANAVNEAAYKKKKLMTELLTSSGIGLPL